MDGAPGAGPREPGAGTDSPRPERGTGRATLLYVEDNLANLDLVETHPGRRGRR